MKHKTNYHTITGFTVTQGGADTPQSTMAVRFLGLLKQPDPNPAPFELDESDVVWSFPSPSSDLSDSVDVVSRSPPTASNSPSSIRQHHQFHPLKSGLSAALSDDLLPLVRRKPTLNPSLSAASAARTIPPVPASPSAAAKFPQSAPVNVPIWRNKVGVSNLGGFDEVVDEDELEEEMVPPHEIVARSHMMTFSVFEGVGRTLKGRDLRRVRNAVFQKTEELDRNRKTKVSGVWSAMCMPHLLVPALLSITARSPTPLLTAASSPSVHRCAASVVGRRVAAGKDLLG